MTKNLLLDATILLGLAILGVVGYKLAPLLNPKTDVALPLSSCNLSQQACVATLPDGEQIGFSIDAYLQAELPPASPIFVVGESGLRAALAEAGFVLLEDSAQPAAAVVVGGDRTVSHDKLKHAIRHVRRGARFIGANPDLLVPVEDGLAPEAGVLLAAIAAGAGVAPTIIGKPERPLLEQALRLMGSTPPAAAILGDRLDTDILGGLRLGLTTILVTTGVDDTAVVRGKVGLLVDLVVAGLGELTDL